MKTNLTLLTDSYKFGHGDMMPKGQTLTYSYGEARKGGQYPNMVWVGLQGIIKKYLCSPITQEDVDEMREISLAHLGTNDLETVKGFQIMVDEGMMYPVKIRSVREGLIIPEGNVLFTIENTDERFPWATNFIESILMKVYYPCIVATRSCNTAKSIREFFAKSSDLPIEVADFLFHDFGYRSCHSEESASIAGFAHILNSKGTDNVPALKYAKDFYKADYSEIAFSVPASEHSISCSYGLEVEDETNYVETLMSRFPNGFLSLVADSKDTVRFIDVIVRSLKDKIVDRWKNGTADVNRIVVRPDSPLFEGEKPWAQTLYLHDLLADIFGFTKNSKGFKVLHPCCGLLYGDGLKDFEIDEIYEKLIENGYSVENMVVGQGGGLVVKNIDRDTNRFAIKASFVIIDGEEKEVRKIPRDKTKASKGGRLSLVKEYGEFSTVKTEDLNGRVDLLETVYANGKMVIDQSLEEIRSIIWNQ